jgi:hypothetical protein
LMAALELRLYPPPQATATNQRPQPDWAAIHRDLRRPGVTLQLLWRNNAAPIPTDAAKAGTANSTVPWEGRLCRRPCGNCMLPASGCSGLRRHDAGSGGRHDQRGARSFDTTASLSCGSSPPSPTTQSRSNGDLLDRLERPAFCGLVCEVVVSSKGERNLRGYFRAAVSGVKIPFPRKRRLSCEHLAVSSAAFTVATQPRLKMRRARLGAGAHLPRGATACVQAFLAIVRRLVSRDRPP